MKVKCRDCGAVTDVEDLKIEVDECGRWQVCTKCGSDDLMELTNCTACGELTEAGDRLCRSCTKALKAQIKVYIKEVSEMFNLDEFDAEDEIVNTFIYGDFEVE